MDPGDAFECTARLQIDFRRLSTGVRDTFFPEKKLVPSLSLLAGHRPPFRSRQLLVPNHEEMGSTNDGKNPDRETPNRQKSRKV